MHFRRSIHSVCAVAVCAAAIALAFGAVGAAPAHAAPPQSAPAPSAQAEQKPPAPPAEKTAAEAFRNIQVLKDVPASQFMSNMFFISASLGVGCDHCHVTAEHGPWPLDKDDKKEKKTAREMMKMMMAINTQNFDGRQEVTCATCHNGHADPAGFSPIRPLGEMRAEPEQAATQTFPPADQILDRYIEALGGAAALESVHTRVLRGSLTFESGHTYSLEVREKAPNLGVFIATSAEGHTSRDGFDGETAWNAAGARVFPSHGLEGARIARDLELFVDTDAKKHYARRFVVGKETVGGEDAWRLRLIGRGDVSEILDFSAASGLLLRRTVLTKTTLGRYAEQTDYSDYRLVDGVKLPFTVARMEVNARYTEKYSEIKQNLPVDESAFHMPAGPK
ncbi:MAG TPA: c-type cytochrome [Candidatus Acidoferrales bacterium]|nr:c-type cytochrome [Candidatus Acidoferrales bacterium]